MELQNVSSGERLHIGFFGMRNAGKSSLVNRITGQQLSIISDIKGTTTDPVKKAMELLPLGAVVIMDTPGLDDEGKLGKLRVQKAEQILEQTDIAVLVADASRGLAPQDKELLHILKKRKIPHIVVYHKADLVTVRKPVEENGLYASSLTGEGIEEIKELLGKFASPVKTKKTLVGDLIEPGDLVVLVTPIDESAPKGRLILPQQLVLREILDKHGIAITCQDDELAKILSSLCVKAKLVITDSQVFEKVSKDTPKEILLTSFSILMARYKGDLEKLLKGMAALSKLHDADKVLISEGCTHHRQCNDIGTVKMPHWIEQFCGGKPEFHFTSGGEFPEDLSEYALIVHCGGCMLNEREMKNRIDRAASAGIPIVNYGIAIAGMNGILERSMEAFSDIRI